MKELQATSTRNYIMILSVFTVVISVFTCLHPLVISIDSIYGFLAYKGTLSTQTFNVLEEVSTGDINQVNKLFVSWWSPGQWIFPGLLIYFFGMKIGVAMIVVTIGSAIAGLYGYYRVFAFFNFPRYIRLLSLIFIFCSSNFYYAFVIYQGGEILSFGVFPWFMLCVLKTNSISLKVLASILFLYLLCFIAKTTLVVYCMIMLAYKPIWYYIENRPVHLQSVGRSLMVLLPAVIGNIIVYLFFLSKGIKPTLINQLNVSFQDILIPLSSPLHSVLSVQQWIWRSEKIVTHHEAGIESSVSIALYLVCFLAVLVAGRRLYKDENINRQYKLAIALLYVGLSAFFIFSYSFDTNIDYSSRHFKLLGFLGLPAFITVLPKRFKPGLIVAATSVFCIFAILDIVYIKNKWTADRFISANYIYRNYDNLEEKDSLDEESYRKLIALDRTLNKEMDKHIIFYVESNEDVAMDLQHVCITQKRREKLYAKIYQGKGPVLVACVSKETLATHPELLSRKFPSYSQFKPLQETNRYQFFLATN